MATGNFAGGILILTFTPLQGWTLVVDKYLNEEERGKANRFYVQAGWDDAPHLSAAEKADMVHRFPAYQRDARMRGVPQLGSGAIYQIEESALMETPFPIPDHWPRAFGLDVGWNRTACIWGALDRGTGCIHLYDEHYYAHAEVGVNARAICGSVTDAEKQTLRQIPGRAAWIPGVIDPAARGRSQVDGAQCLQNYRDQGLDVETAVNAREAGIQLVHDLMLSGKLKIFASLTNWWSEFRLYRRDEKGQVVKQNDHLQDATRYLIVSGRDRMKIKPVKKAQQGLGYSSGGGQGSWMG